jgi:hypothetical protein
MSICAKWMFSGVAHHASCGSIGTQRAADVGRYGESSRAGPSVIGKLACHVKTSPAHDSKPRDARYLDRGTTRWNSRAPASETAGPLPRRKAPGIRGTLKGSIGLNPHPKSKTLRDYR